MRGFFMVGVAAALVSAPAVAQEAQLKAFVATDLHKSLINDTLAQLPTEVFQRCEALKSSGTQIAVILPVSFGTDGMPVAGTWKESFPVTGCGNDTIINVFFTVTPDKKVHTLIGLVGTSMADPLLQKDAMQYAVLASGFKKNETCNTLYVTDTKFLKVTGPQQKNAPAAPWDEMWTLTACTQKVQVMMHFIPDATGTTIHTDPKETKPVAM